MEKNEQQLEQGELDQNAQKVREKLSEAIRNSCARRFGFLEANFLCESVSVLHPALPRVVNEGESLSVVLEILAKNNIGCILVVNEEGKLSGIFSERDLITKVIPSGVLFHSTRVSEWMTKGPLAERADVTIAFALTLMSQGGFRHLPLVDQDSRPVGILSVKNVVDYLVSTMVSDLLSFELPTAP